MRQGRGLAPGQAAAASHVEARLAAPETALTTLAVAAQEGEPGARERLVEQALPLIQRCAARYAGRDLERADLIQEGALPVTGRSR